MKINYKNPKTGKPSTVNLPDHWVNVYLSVMAGSWARLGPDADRKAAIDQLLHFCLERYFDPTGNNDLPLMPDSPGPSECTFTTYLETYMASTIESRCHAALKLENPLRSSKANKKA